MKQVRLLNRLPLLPQESLISLLGRLSIANYYEQTNAVIQLCRTNLSERDWIERPQKAETWTLLSHITGLSKETLYKGSVHPYVTMFAAPWESPADTRYVTSRQHNDLLSILDARYCPHCFREQPYHRLPWQNRYVAVCIKHNCLLQTGCPGCNRKISIMHLMQGQCHRCQFKFAATEPMNVSADERAVLAHEILQSLFGDATPPKALPSHLLKQPIQVIVELLRGLISTLRCVPTAWSLENYTYPPDDRPSLRGVLRDTKQMFMFVHLAMEVLMDWPTGFAKFLEMRRQHRQNPTGLVAGDLGNIYSRWIEVRWNRPEFEFLQTVFDDYLVENFAYTRSLYRLARYRENADFRQRFPYLSPVHAYWEFKIRPRKVKELMKKGEERFCLGENLRTYEINGRKFVSRQEILALLDATTRLISTDEVATYLSTTKSIIRALADHNLLAIWQRHILVDSLNDFVKRLEEISMRSSQFGFSMTPRQVVSQLKLKAKKAIPQILKAIFQGQVRCFWGKKGLMGLQVCVADLAQIPQFAELVLE